MSADPDERLFTPAQCAHIAKLYSAFEQAQRQLNDFAVYLMTEHGIDDPAHWQLSADLTRFVRVTRDSGDDTA